MTTATSVPGIVYLHPISGGEVTIPPCDGTKTIADNGQDVFTGWIDSDFKSWGANDSGPATPATPVVVYELSENGDFATLFGSLSKDTDALCLTQHQILDFVRGNQHLLRTDGYATHFLFKSGGKKFVARVHRRDDGTLAVNVCHFESDRVWYAMYRFRLVVPQLAA